MSGSCVALLASQDGLADQIQSQLQGRLKMEIVRCDFNTVADYLSWDNDGLLLLLWDSPEDLHRLQFVVQDVSLQQLPISMALLQSGAAASSAETNMEYQETTDELDAYLVGRFCWPHDAEKISRLVDSHEHCYCPFVDQTDQPLDDLLSRQLQGQTPSLVSLADRVSLAAQHDVTVLLTGETGTGKTYIARLIHNHSARKEHRFLQIACGALAPNLVASEFFGHVRGAFTGADRNKVGKFAAVGKGTLLLDEIDTLALEQQAMLLRVIETGEFEPVGSVDTQKCEARLIVASNIHLEQAVEKHTFRPDLYFRLNVMSFHLPPLRERIQDIAPLAQYMASRFNRKFNKQLFAISSQALNALESFPWPGNIRQLENAVQHAVLVSTGSELLLQHLPEAVQANASQLHWYNGANGSNGKHDENANNYLHQQRDHAERDTIRRALVKNGYSRTRAAEMLGISRVTLYKKMKKYRLMDLPSK